MDGADAMLSGETAAETIRFKYSKMTQIIEAENSPLIQVPQTHQKLKQNVLSKQFVVMQQLWLMLSKQSYFYYDQQWLYCVSISLETIYSSYFSIYI
jgi:hypothetical protein